MDLILGMAFKGLLFFFVLACLAGYLKSAKFKGRIGEATAQLSARLFLDPVEYRALHNVTIPTADGTTQIDHIFVSRYGVFVVETKNYAGWIFGSEQQATWTQKLHQKSFKFQNPLRQNYKHVKELERLLGIDVKAIHSVITFMGEAELKTPMPPNVTIGGGYTRYIKSKQGVLLTEQEVDRIFNAIQSGQLTQSRATDAAHVRNLQQRHTAPVVASVSVVNACPVCGSEMVQRTRKSGTSAGTHFWGCSQYPKCRGTKA